MQRSAFGNDTWNHGKNHGRDIVCKDCAAAGKSSTYLRLYLCHRCGEEHGHNKFDKKDVKNFKSRDGKPKLSCMQCKANKVNDDNEKEKRLLALLKSPDALKCTCKGKQIPRKQRAWYALNKDVHTVDCKLWPTSMGQKLWEGKNVGILKADLQFLCDRKAY